MFFPPVCRWKNNLYELHRYRKLCRRDTDGSDNARSRCRYGSAGNGQPRRATLFRRNILSDHVRSLGRYVTLQRQPPGRIAGHIAGNLESRFPRALPRTVSLAELHAGDSCKQSAVCPRRGHCTWSSGNRKNDHLSGSHLRNPASGTAGTGMCPKQYCRRLDFGKTCGPWRQCPAYRQSDPCQRQDAFLYLRASFREPSALSGTVEHPEKSP